MTPIVRYVAIGCALLAVDAVAVTVRRSREDPARRASLRDAESAVARFLEATSALHSSGGDPRLADRLPTTPDLAAEILSGIAFAQRRLGADERDQLVKLEQAGSRWLPTGAAEVRTREFWVFRTAARGGSEQSAPLSAVWNVRYELVREGASWRVVEFRLANPGALADEDG